jgi:serine/threonine protein kinase
MTKISCNSCQREIEVTDSKQRVIHCDTCHTFIDLNELSNYTFLSIGEFEIIQQIGQGAMGTVYEAIQKNLDRKVALKVLPPTPSTEHQVMVQRFLHEMKLAAQIEHPYIVSVHQAGEAQGFPYYSMNLVQGHNLEELVHRDGPFNEAEALIIALHVAEALGSIWNEFQIIHRDIKPSNIMLNHKSTVQVLDMGLAKGLNESLDFTRTGMALGSPLFLSPEQASQESIDFRTDIFSLGTTLYYLLSGHVPFAGESIAEILHNVVNNKYKPISHYTDVISSETSLLLEMMMSKNQDDRFESWTDLINTLRYMLTDSEHDEISIFDTCRRQALVDENTRTENTEHINNFDQTATSIIKNDCEVSAGEYNRIETRTISGSTNPTYEALINYSTTQAKLIQGLTGIMDWVPYEKCPEVKNILQDFRLNLSDMVNALQDFSFLSENKKSIHYEKIEIKHLSHRIKSTMRSFCITDNITFIFETSYDYDEVVSTDLELLLKILASAVRYFTHGMSRGELEVKLIKQEEHMDVELLRRPAKQEPSYKLGEHAKHLNTIEGAYFHLAAEMAKSLNGSLGLHQNSENIIKFSFAKA